MRRPVVAVPHLVGSMRLDQRYEFLEPVPGLVVHSDKALRSRQISSGRPVTVHLLAGGHSMENAALLQELETLATEHRGRVLEVSDYYGTVSGVTEGRPWSLPWGKGVAGRRAAPAAPDENALSRARAWKIPAASQAKPG